MPALQRHHAMCCQYIANNRKLPQNQVKRETEM